MREFVQSENFIAGLKCLFYNGTVLGAASVDWRMALEFAELILKVSLLLLTFCFTAYQFRKAAKKDKQ